MKEKKEKKEKKEEKEEKEEKEVKEEKEEKKEKEKTTKKKGKKTKSKLIGKKRKLSKQKNEAIIEGKEKNEVKEKSEEKAQTEEKVQKEQKKEKEQKEQKKEKEKEKEQSEQAEQKESVIKDNEINMTKKELNKMDNLIKKITFNVDEILAKNEKYQKFFEQDCKEKNISINNNKNLETKIELTKYIQIISEVLNVPISLNNMIQNMNETKINA